MNPIAIGATTTAAGMDAVAVGSNAHAVGDQATAVGGGVNVAAGKTGAAGANATGAKASAFGTGSFANGDNATAVGEQATASGATASAFGQSATASGNNVAAIGLGATASQDNALALGALATASVANSVALGTNSVAATAAVPVTGDTIAGTAYTYAGSASGVVSVGAAGAERQITNVAPGQVLGTSTDAVNGSQLYATDTALNATSASLNALSTTVVTNVSSLSTGVASLSTGMTSLSTGVSSLSTGLANAVMYDDASKSQVTLGGAGSTAPVKLSNVADGVNANDAVNVEQLSTSVANAKPHYVSINDGGLVGLGNYNGDGATAAGAIAIGPGAVANVGNSVALGANAVTVAPVPVSSGSNGGLTYGNFAGATPVGVVSVGAAGAERQITNVAAGQVGAVSTDAINGSQLYSAVDALSTTISSSVAGAKPHYVSINDGGLVGLGNYNGDGATGLSAIAIGPNAQSGGQSAVALGLASTASGTNSVAIGPGATASVANSVALGANAQATTAATPVVGAAIGNTLYAGFAGGAPVGVVSVGSPGRERQITNVAAGQITANSTDAINGSELYSVADNLSNSIASAKTHYVSINDGGTPAGNYNGDGATTLGAIAIGQNAASGGLGSVALGTGSTASAELGVAIGQGARANVGNSVALGAGAVTGIANPVPGAVIGNTLYTGFAGNAPVGVVSVGLPGAERQITNVAAGSITANSTDAINGSELYSVANGLSSSIAGAKTHYVSINDGGTPAVNYNGDGATTLGAIAIGQNAASGGLGSVALGTGSTASAELGVAIGPGATANVVNSVAIGPGAVTGTATAVSSAAVGGITYGGFAGSAPAGVVSVGSVGFERQITNVAAGQIGANSTDAINGSQLYSVASEVAALSTGLSTTNSSVASLSTSTQGGLTSLSTGLSTTNSTVADLKKGVTYGFVADTKGNGTDQPTVTKGSNSAAIGANSSDGGRSNVVSVGAPGAERQITNVAAGTQATDAVNVQQLNQSVTQGVGQANSYTDQRINDVNNRIDSDRRDANAGSASAMAVANLPQPTTPGRSMVSLGGAVYQGQSGQALGLSHVTESDRWVYKGAVSTNTRGAYGVAVSAGYQW
ncbi:YadA family autotransporter adhesin [Paraburkholderia humisilvae]|uniref:YadA family autotransporter adhesin n=2 Tax=Paraburkholderia humisilvae TaxID=627669 RepID=UPI003605BABB